MKLQKALVVLLLLGFATCILITFRQEYLQFGITSYDVRIINGFSNNSSLPLVVWCVSHDGGDIGGRALQERDDYSWTVKTGPFSSGSTRFICTLKWDERRKKFEAFRASRDRYKCGACGKCLWLVKEDGFYFSNGGNWAKDFSWM